ncbi:ABC transporter substrate-binding protein [Winslowiella iniecta]|uniref:Iron-siderophore ABC transporter substrate-binding protein n=1 Tax=Winslowiella iniecta TaxID=1560201 RepID=A0A0L7T788_9GAMM|nr:ABC transporter substrate-binding protein [Winslowiella iniecta]KOC91061.1 iron-siderophore ABC transporter substrate-binding protein [Winslowiella iniecta]KOC93798.1 iron-siderophore ABC transporter substrate-binding protein [Winslowiella iniecta]
MLWRQRFLLLLILTPLLSSAQSPGYPLTLVTGLGKAEIKAAPKRIVALGAGAEDIVLQLGTVPVGIEAHYWGGDKQGYLPWFREEVERRNAALPAILNLYPETDIEAILRLQPDLVVATQSGMTQEVFDHLSWFVPVVAWPKSPWLTTPSQQIKLIAQALNRDPQPLLNDLDLTLKQAAATIPDIHRYTFAYIRGGASGGTLTAYASGDPRVDTLTHLGLTLLPSLAQQTPRFGSFTSFIGLENAERLNDADIVISWYLNQRDRNSVEAQPLFRSIRAYQQGGYIPMMDQALVVAMGYGTPLSVRWGIHRFMPMLQEAIAHVKRRTD